MTTRIYNVATHEKIETIVGCYLQHGTTAGAFGSLVITADEDGLNRRFAVTADGRTVTCGTDRHGWFASAGHFTAHGERLIDALLDLRDAEAGR